VIFCYQNTYYLYNLSQLQWFRQVQRSSKIPNSVSTFLSLHDIKPVSKPFSKEVHNHCQLLPISATFFNCSSKLIKMSQRHVKVLDSHLSELSGPLVEFSTLLSIQYHLFCRLHCEKKKPLNNSNTHANSTHKL
jgi:hypothetical protein